MIIRKNWLLGGLGSVAILAFIIAITWPNTSSQGQDKKDLPDQTKHIQPSDQGDLNKQIADLRSQVTQLEATLAKMAPPKSMGGMSMGGMGMGDKSGMKGGGMGMDMMMGGMSNKKGGGMGGMMDMDMMGGGMGGMGAGGMSGMSGMMDDDMDMMGMMGKGSMGSKGMKMKTQAALPGFPGASHVYHIGATDFFLDHPEHITLSTQQQTNLNRAKQKALTDKASMQRKIDEAEQELWELTGADQPNAAQIEAKVKDIEKLRSDQRLAFIRSVGEAAKILTDEQRQILLGTVQPKSSSKQDHSTHPKTP